jgi:signal peptidase I
MLSLIIGILAFANFVLGPIILYFSARILRIKSVTFWRAYLCFLLLTAAALPVNAMSLLAFPGSIAVTIAEAVVILTLLPLIVKWVLRTTFWRAVGCWILQVVLCVGLALGIRAVAVEAFTIYGTSMSPTIAAGDKLLVDKISGRVGGFRRGDIVAFYPPQDPASVHIKRIVGVAGDRIEVRDSVVYVNGAASGRCSLIPYHPAGMARLQFPCTVPPDKLFMLGDNRDYSLDSRQFGFADAKAVIGLAVVVYASVEQPLDPYAKIVLRREGKDPDKVSHPNRIRWERVGTVLK